MLVIGSNMINSSVLSLHVGGKIADIKEAVIDPEELKILAYTVSGPIIHNDPDVGDILVTDDVREVNMNGLIIDSTDVLVKRDDVVKIDKIMKLNFELVGLKVVTKDGKKIGKVIDYTFDSQSFMIYQLIVQRPVGLLALNDPNLTINRSQIVEIDDYTVTIKHDKEQVKVFEKKEKAVEEPVVPKPSYVNPFRKPGFVQEENSESASKISE